MTEREPTEEMLLAGIAAANRQMPYINDTQKVLAIWKAMQARATPALPQRDHTMDAFVLGTGFMKDGKRVDPKDVYKQALPQDDSESPDGYAEGWNAARRAMLNGALETKVPQGVEEWIAEHEEYFTEIRNTFRDPVSRINTDDLRAYLSGMAIVPVERITTVARDVEYSPHTSKHTPFLRVSFVYDDYDSRDKVYAMLAAAKEKQS